MCINKQNYWNFHYNRKLATLKCSFLSNTNQYLQPIIKLKDEIKLKHNYNSKLNLTLKQQHYCRTRGKPSPFDNYIILN